MEPILLITAGVLGVLAILIIWAILMQEGTRGGLGALTGGAQEKLDRNFGRTIDAKLAKFTKYAAAIFFILTLAVTIITKYSK